MHDIFNLSDLADDIQYRMLAYWVDAVRRDDRVPVSAFERRRIPFDIGRDFLLFDLSAGSIRDARILEAGRLVERNVGTDLVGKTLEGILPPDYVSGVIPAYALCAGSFLPLSSLDEASFDDGVTRLVRRLILPLSRQPAGASHAAGHLLAVFAPENRGLDDPMEPGCCRRLSGIRSLGVSLFREGWTRV